MDTIIFKETIRNRLIDSAKKYNTLLGKKIVIASESFYVKKVYVIRFYETNFLHLTGVKQLYHLLISLLNALMERFQLMILIVSQQLN